MNNGTTSQFTAVHLSKPRDIFYSKIVILPTVTKVTDDLITDDFCVKADDPWRNRTISRLIRDMSRVGNTSLRFFLFLPRDMSE